VNARQAVVRALADPRFGSFFTHSLRVIAVGKAASAMATELAAYPGLRLSSVLAIGTHAVADMPSSIEWHQSAHPIPDERSVVAGLRALEIASAVTPGDGLLLLISGGASALMAVPGDGLTLADKQRAIHAMLLGGADIHQLNTVRKHLSRVKGGRLAAACRGTTLTLAVSDVVGDDISVIGSGPGVADVSTSRDALMALQRYAPASAALPLTETPKPGAPELDRATAYVIASRRHALESASEAAAALGYAVGVMPREITGEARAVSPHWLTEARSRAAALPQPACVLSAGETIVHVRGSGRGGRNQEFVLALVDSLSHMTTDCVVASIGTDGIDGPTDAAGALADRTTRARASVLDFHPPAFLADNNAYEFFANLGDLVHLGRTDTNVGDVQVLLTAKGG
jgi:glycerate 2-kinase